jgi:uncharacterized protein YjiS (DUF1127 family)
MCHAVERRLELLARQIAAARVGRLFRRTALELKVRRDLRRLSFLDDRMLRDIGINRRDIDGSVRHPAERAAHLGDRAPPRA